MYTLIPKHFFILLLIIGVGAFLRFFKLTEFPVQLNHDEITQLYDAISIAQTGRDIYGNFLPAIFHSIGDYKSPSYTYITSLFFMVFGWQELTVRLPGVFFGLFMIPAVCLFTIKLLKNRSIALLSAFFTSIAPFEIFFSRKSFENVSGVFLMLLGFSCCLSYIENKRLYWFYLAVGSFAAAMYTYFSHALLIPLLLTIFLVIFRRQIFLNFKRAWVPALVFIILVTPIIFLVLTDSDARFRTQTVFIKQDVNLGRILTLVKEDNQILDNFMKSKMILDYVFNRYLQQFNPVYLFSTGLDFTNRGLLGIGPLFLIQFPLLILGAVYLIRLTGLKKQKKFIIAWIIIGMLPSGLTFESYSPHRVIIVFTMLNILSAIGLFWVVKLIRKYQKFSAGLLGGVIIALGFNVIFFLHMYFINYPFEKSQYLQYPFKQIALYAWSQYSNFDSIVFDPQFGDVAPQIGVGAHYYFAYFGNVPPAKFQKDYQVGTKPREVIFDKFSIRQVYWPADKDLKNTLVIVSPWSVPESDISDKSKIIKRFNFYNGKLAFYAIKL